MNLKERVEAWTARIPNGEPFSVAMTKFVQSELAHERESVAEFLRFNAEYLEASGDALDQFAAKQLRKKAANIEAGEHRGMVLLARPDDAESDPVRPSGTVSIGPPEGERR